MVRKKYHFKCPTCGFEVISSSYSRSCAKCETQMDIFEVMNSEKEGKEDETKD